MGAILTSLRVGLVRRWRLGVMAIFTVLGSLWLVTEVAAFLSEDAKETLQGNPAWYVAIATFLAIGGFVVATYEPRSVKVRIPTTDTTIHLKYGDLFKEECDLLIAANEFFDGSLGQRVSPQSVHGQFIQKFFQSDSTRFDQAITLSLQGTKGRSTRRAPPPNVAYPTGTTAVVDLGGRTAFLFVLTKTDLISSKASTDIPSLWVALSGALSAARHFGNGRPLALPLVGNGLSGLNLPPQQLLRLLTLCLVQFGREKSLPKSVSLVLPEQCFEYLDLREIEHDWRPR